MIEISTTARERARRLAEAYKTLNGERSLYLSPAGAGNRIEDLESSWRNWLAHFFPIHFATFSTFHAEFWDWAWSVESGQQPQPFIAIWPRGAGKSTNAEAAAVALGARSRRRYVLYVSGTQDQADDHVSNIAGLLESPTIAVQYPDLGTKLLNKFGNSKGWRRNRIRTQAGLTIDAIGLETAARGVKLEETRPDFIIFDDIDSETDSIDAVARKIKIITRALIPSGARDVGILGVQNLVHKDSVFSQLADARADFLADRSISGPHPAIRHFDYEKQGSRYIITHGEATWDGMPITRCQEMIDDMGIRAFLAECQHEVTKIGEEFTFAEFNEIFHVITWSEFASYYEQSGGMARIVSGLPFIPKRWNKARGLDWGTTKKHPAAAIYATRPHQMDALSDSAFIFGEIIRPLWSPINLDAEPEIVSPGRLARAIRDFNLRFAIDDKEIKVSLMSHEASAALNTFLVDLPDDLKIFFNKWKAKRGSGVPQVQEKLAIDYSLPHPFRTHPITRQPIMGRPRLYLIVADGQGELYVDGDNNLKVRPYVDSLGLARLRWELPQYEVERTGQHKIDDDAVDALLGMAAQFFVASAPLTESEKIDKIVPIQLQTVAIKRAEAAEQVRLIQAREFMAREAQRDAEDERENERMKAGIRSPHLRAGRVRLPTRR